MTMGARIQELRRQKGLSQEALGEALGVSRQAISKGESDTTIPEVDKLVALSRLFGVSVGALLGVEEEPEPGETEPGPGAEKRAPEELTDRELRGGLEIRLNLMGELRGDSASRATWYKNMRETGAFSVNEIRALEDLPPVPGGDTHYASLNYVPLEDFRQLSTTRAESRQPAD